MPKLVRRSRDFWTSLVEDYERGDHRESHREFAARHGVGCGSFERWLYRVLPASMRSRDLTVWPRSAG